TTAPQPASASSRTERASANPSTGGCPPHPAATTTVPAIPTSVTDKRQPFTIVDDVRARHTTGEALSALSGAGGRPPPPAASPAAAPWPCRHGRRPRPGAAPRRAGPRRHPRRAETRRQGRAA